MLGVVGTRTLLPRRHRQAIARVTVSALVASLPLLYVSLLRPPPAALAGDTAFWFLMSNCVIAAIVATADDPGTLFFGSSSDDDRTCCNVDTVVPLAAVNDPAVVTMKAGGGQEEVVASTVAGTGSNPVDLAASSPFLIQAESGDAPNHTHVSVLQQGEQHDAATTIELGTDKNTTAVTMVVEGQGEDQDGETASPPPASGGALAEPPETEAEPDPWVPKLVTSKSLLDQEVQEEEAADKKWLVPLYSRPPDMVAHENGGRLRRWATTDGSKSVAEESEYWQLSDEELNRRVEDFIARFNRQIEQEAGV